MSDSLSLSTGLMLPHRLLLVVAAAAAVAVTLSSAHMQGAQAAQSAATSFANTGVVFKHKHINGTGTIAVVRLPSAPTVLFLWSSIGIPVIVIARYKHAAPVPDLGSWNWTKIAAHDFDSSALFISKHNLTSIQGFAARELIEFDDKGKTAILTDANFVRAVSLANLHWLMPEISKDNRSVTFTSLEKRLSIMLTAYDEECEASANPRLTVTPGTTTVAFQVRNFTYTKPKGKMAVGYSILTTGHEDITLRETRSINDERCPRVFQFEDISLGAGEGYVAWKPVCYGSSARENMNSTLMHSSKIAAQTDLESMRQSAANALFTSASAPQSFSFNVSIGEDGDLIYGQSSFDWTIATGIGEAKNDVSLSSAVVGLLFGSLGTPLVVGVVGGGYVVVRYLLARAGRRSGYHTIN